MAEATTTGRAKRAARGRAPTTPDPIETAMEAEASGVAPTGVAHRLLEKQERLVSWQIADARVGATLKGLTIAAGLCLAVAIGLWLWRSHESRGLVIEAFDTPPSLAQRGVTGKVLAGLLQDRLDQMQAATVTTDAARQLSNRWSGDIRIEISDTGISLSELDRLARHWLGNEVRVSGQLYELPKPGAVALVVRTSAGPGVRSEGSEADLDRLVQAAAETVYRQTQPSRYAEWLTQNGRDGEAQFMMAWLSRHGRPVERAAAYVGLAVDPRTSWAESARMLAAAAQLDPKSPSLWTARAGFAALSGNMEAAVANAKRAEQLTARRKGLSADGAAYLTYLNRSNRAAYLGAYLDSIADGARQAQYASVETNAAANRLSDANLMALNHDVAASRAALAETQAPPETAPLGDRVAYNAMVLRVRTSQALVLEDWRQMLAASNELEATGLETRFPGRWSAVHRARALGRLGEHDQAEAVLRQTSLNCYPCVVARAEASALKGDWGSAELWFRRADALGPSLPFGQTIWGERLLAAGRLDAAIGKLKLAHQRAPRFADPLELWGEALLAAGKPQAAARKFAAAAELAPRWGRVHLKWGEALAAQGKTGEAQAKWRAAAGMDLTGAERAGVQALIQKRTT